MLKRIQSILFLLIVAMFAMPASGSVQVSAKLDSVYIQMGRTTLLHLTVTQPKEAKGSLPMLQRLRENGIIPVCGDSVEFRAPSKIDTVESGSNITIKYEIPIQAFDSGYYRLPEIAFAVGNDTAYSKSLSLKVVPVKATAETPINDYASTAQPDGSSIFDYLPDWLIDLWWIFLILILAAVCGIYAMKRYRSQGYILPQKPQPTPYEVALNSLNLLKEKKLWEQGQEKEYYTELTEILRSYLDKRFGINAMEMTSRQILNALNENPEIRDKKAMIRQILDMADFVKFAKVRPVPDDNIKAFDNALQFVRDTKPQPVEEKGGDK